ncbi:hypothetical protein OIU78_001205 [Salix suchowensis]|nr:hypothetical protein OIU78_001205 [Salix suchowensis]
MTASVKFSVLLGNKAFKIGKESKRRNHGVLRVRITIYQLLPIYIVNELKSIVWICEFPLFFLTCKFHLSMPLQ